VRGKPTQFLGFGLIVAVFGGLLVYGVANRAAEQPPPPALRPLRAGDTFVYESFAPNAGTLTLTVTGVSPAGTGRACVCRAEFDRHIPGERIGSGKESEGQADRSEKTVATHKFFQDADGSLTWRGRVSGPPIPGLSFAPLPLRSPLAPGDGDAGNGYAYRVGEARRLRAERRYLMAYPVEYGTTPGSSSTAAWTDWYAEHPFPVCRVPGRPNHKAPADLPTFRLYEFRPGAW
jgi:hypothetical protein